jgi:hypothetical protein
MCHFANVRIDGQPGDHGLFFEITVGALLFIKEGEKITA